MEPDPEKGVPRVFAREHPNHWINVTAEDIPHGWIDDMVKRLFEELNRQMLRLENATKNKPLSDDDEKKRAEDARTFKSLQVSMERLTALDTTRASLRKVNRNKEKPGERRARLARQLTQQLGPAGIRKLLGEPQ